MHMLHTGLVASHGMKRKASGLPATVWHREEVKNTSKITTNENKNVNDCMKTERLQKSGLANSKYVYPLNIMKVVYFWNAEFRSVSIIRGTELNNLTSYSTIECN